MTLLMLALHCSVNAWQRRSHRVIWQPVRKLLTNQCNKMCGKITSQSSYPISEASNRHRLTNYQTKISTIGTKYAPENTTQFQSIEVRSQLFCRAVVVRNTNQHLWVPWLSPSTKSNSSNPKSREPRTRTRANTSSLNNLSRNLTRVSAVSCTLMQQFMPLRRRIRRYWAS